MAMASGEMKLLYLIRHCDTREPDAENAPVARHDLPLSTVGRRQADQLATYLREVPLDLILTSLYQRAQETAATINQERGLPVFASMALNEYFLSDDGRGVESSEQGLARSLGFLLQFSPYYEHIAVVAHNSILSTLRMSVLNLPFSESREAFPVPGTCYILRYDASQGDQNWRGIATFVPGTSSP
jgi:broad specificity phosphatase PhoE